MRNTFSMFLVCIVFIWLGLYLDKEWDPMQSINELPITFMLIILFAAVGSYAVKKYVDPILNMIPGMEQSADITPSDSKW